MDEYPHTGYLKQCFVNETRHGKVCNFYVKGSGYQSVNGEYKNVPPLKFETWLLELVVKLQKIPRESLVTVYFNIVPKRVLIEGKNIDAHILKANRVIHWDKPKKEKDRDEEASSHYYQEEWTFSEGPSE